MSLSWGCCFDATLGSGGGSIRSGSLNTASLIWSQSAERWRSFTSWRLTAGTAPIKEFVKNSKLRVSGPNCMGQFSYREHLFAYPNTELCRVPAGSVGCAFQSGGTLQFYMKTSSDRGLRFSYGVTTGNEVDMDIADFMNFYVDDADALWERIKGSCTAEWGPEDMPYGLREFAIKDPNGYFLSFGSAIKQAPGNS